MRLTELANVDQLQVELIRHGWQKRKIPLPKAEGAFFIYEEQRCPTCGQLHRTLSMYPQHDGFEADVWVSASIAPSGQINSWCVGENYGPSAEELAPTDITLDQKSIARATNNWFSAKR